MGEHKRKKSDIDWNDPDSVTRAWARLNVDSHIHGSTARWIVAAAKKIEELESLISRKDVLTEEDEKEIRLARVLVKMSDRNVVADCLRNILAIFDRLTGQKP